MHVCEKRALPPISGDEPPHQAERALSAEPRAHERSARADPSTFRGVGGVVPRAESKQNGAEEGCCEEVAREEGAREEVAREEVHQEEVACEEEEVTLSSEEGHSFVLAC